MFVLIFKPPPLNYLLTFDFHHWNVMIVLIFHQLASEKDQSIDCSHFLLEFESNVSINQCIRSIFVSFEFAFDLFHSSLSINVVLSVHISHLLPMDRNNSVWNSHSRLFIYFLCAIDYAHLYIIHIERLYFHIL